MSDAALTVHILHTNDFHSRLTEQGVARLRQAIADLNGAPYLLLDAGDAVKAGNIGVNPFGEPILTTMSELGYHAMTMGNREFHVWRAALSAKINRARFPVLCANVYAKSPEATGDGLPVRSHVLLPVGGLTIGIFGLTVPMVTPKMRAAALSQFLFDDPIAAAKRQVLELRYKADLLIALTHIGLTQDRRLAESVSGIDLIIGGHSHHSLTAPEVVSETPIVQTGAHAHSFGHCRMEFRRSGIRTEYALSALQEKGAQKRK
ncbi:MAG: metallophosphatase [Capsulimonadales bacterium]|nr:metallophosphatase [Capsulimonadales bacterium]